MTAAEGQRRRRWPQSLNVEVILQQPRFFNLTLGLILAPLSSGSSHPRTPSQLARAFSHSLYASPLDRSLAQDIDRTQWRRRRRRLGLGLSFSFGRSLLFESPPSSQSVVSSEESDTATTDKVTTGAPPSQQQQQQAGTPLPFSFLEVEVWGRERREG